METIIGLTGGIASGKSTVSSYLAQKGIPVFDADRAAWHVEEKGSACLRELVARFGKEILLPDGTLDRPRLAALAFGSAEGTKDLNRIVHRAVERERDAFLAAHKNDRLVVIDAPLLLECGWQALTDTVWLVFIPEEEQIRRAMRRSGLSRNEVAARIRRQMPLSEKRKMADLVIDNGGSLENLYAQVEAALQGVLSR
jgi:dephospho-CoA kinase